MDYTDKNFIMCVSALEIQEAWIPHSGDYYIEQADEKPKTEWTEYDRNELLVHRILGSDDEQNLCSMSMVNHIKANGVWLPHQGQLQDMVASKCVEFLVSDFHEFTNPDDYCTHEYHEAGFYAQPCCGECRDKRVSIYKQFTSMEQLWLAFVMKELYGKVWDDEKEDWIKQS